VSGAEDVALREAAQGVYAQVRTNVVHTIVTQYAAKVCIDRLGSQVDDLRL
jgi:hypothetical protein